MKKTLLIVCFLIAISSSLKAGVFLAAGGAYKNYTQKYYKYRIIDSGQNTTIDDHFKFNGVTPIFMLGYNFSNLRLHFDYYPETKLAIKDVRSKKVINKSSSIAEYNLMLDFMADIHHEAKVYIGVGAGRVLIKPIIGREKTASQIAPIAELGMFYYLGPFDLGLGIKSYIIDMELDENFYTPNNSGSEAQAKYYSKIRANSLELFIAYRFH